MIGVRPSMRLNQSPKTHFTPDFEIGVSTNVDRPVKRVMWPLLFKSQSDPGFYRLISAMKSNAVFVSKDGSIRVICIIRPSRRFDCDPRLLSMR